MKIDDVIGYLRTPAKWNSNICRLECKREALISCLPHGTLTAGVKDFTETVKERVMRIDAEIKEAREKKEEDVERLKIELSAWINAGVITDTQMEILASYYWDGVTIERISRKVLYSEAHVKRLKKAALETLAGIMEEEA